ncbi:LysR family transcriptional regulator [Kordiimonas marina]|uniref:LysR family transcriptional regulator n=1 Tax=Kordiimonas marina TaxID=2872312 RepID=UPI001FF65F8A|nr:LysR family transcriptional regulator [Kordiimonas marina]MCJ9429048.1 LysR family transcriptional regulator [Kordiimonas marina]
MMDLYLLRYFLAVVETGSFTRAADRVFVTQPTLSAGIKKLETQVGQPLFERSNRRVFLTEAGTRFLPRAKAILHECNMAMQALEETRAAPVIRLGVLTTISTRAMGDLLAGFKKQAPEVVLEIVDGTEQELLNRLEDRSLDYALSVHRGAGPDQAIALREEGYVFILPAGHALASRTRLVAADLAEEHMVVRSRCEVLSETSRYFTDQNIRPRLVYRTPNDSRAISMVAAGLGGTVVPESLVDERVTSARLQGFDYKRRLALYRPRYELPPVVAAAGQQFEGYVATVWCG